MRPRQCTAAIAAIHPVQFEELRHIDTPTELNERIRKFEPTNYLSSRDKSTLEESSVEPTKIEESRIESTPIRWACNIRDRCQHDRRGRGLGPHLRFIAHTKRKGLWLA